MEMATRLPNDVTQAFAEILQDMDDAVDVQHAIKEYECHESDRLLERAWEIPFPQYLQQKLISSHGLIELFEKSPAHYFYQTYLQKEFKETPAFRRGRLAHKAVLEPKEFNKWCKVMPACDRRTKEGKATYEAFMQKVEPSHIVVEEEEADMLTEMINGLMRHERAWNIMTAGINERTLYFEHEDLLWKMRPDKLIPEKDIIVDYKTAACVKFAKFRSSIERYHYDMQAYVYTLGYEKVFKRKPRAFLWVAQEPEETCAVQVFNANIAVLQNGEEKVNYAVKKLKQCLAKHEQLEQELGPDFDYQLAWPSYSDKIQDMDVSTWGYFTAPEEEENAAFD